MNTYRVGPDTGARNAGLDSKHIFHLNEVGTKTERERDPEECLKYCSQR